MVLPPIRMLLPDYRASISFSKTIDNLEKNIKNIFDHNIVRRIISKLLTFYFILSGELKWILNKYIQEKITIQNSQCNSVYIPLSSLI